MKLIEKQTGAILGYGFISLDESGAHTAYGVLQGVSPETHELVDGVMPVPEEVSIQNNREARNTKLRESDWTQLSDVLLTEDCKAAFLEYRAALRAIDLAAPAWPIRPAEVWAD